MTTFSPTAPPLLNELGTLLSGALNSLPSAVQHVHAFILASAVSELKEKLSEVLTVLMLFGFLMGTIRIMGGAAQMQRGNTEEGKAAILSGALIAAAPLIMKVLFEIFFNSSGVVFGN